MKISIAMVTYNHEKYIKEALDSILMQKTNYEYEIIIGEDCSTDSTREILYEYKSKYPKKIKLLIREKNVGVLNNVLDVYRNCSGDYIAILDGDDYWTDPKKLEKVIRRLEKKDIIGICHGYDILKDGTRKKSLNEIPPKGIYQNRNDYYKFGGIWTLTMVFKNIFKNQDNIEKLKELCKNSDFIIDVPLKVLLLSLGKIEFLEDRMGVYRVGAVKTSFSSGGILRQVNESIAVKDAIIDFFGETEKEIIKESIIKVYLGAILMFLKRFEIKNAYNYFFKVIPKRYKKDCLIILPKYLYLKIRKKTF